MHHDKIEEFIIFIRLLYFDTYEKDYKPELKQIVKRTQRLIDKRFSKLKPVNPIVAKAEGLQSQGGEDAAVVNYRKPSPTQGLMFLGFPDG